MQANLGFTDCRSEIHARQHRAIHIGSDQDNLCVRGCVRAYAHMCLHRCLTPASAERRDILGIATLMTGQLMNCIDDVLRLQSTAAAVGARNQRRSTYVVCTRTRLCRSGNNSANESLNLSGGSAHPDSLAAAAPVGSGTPAMRISDSAQKLARTKRQLETRARRAIKALPAEQHRLTKIDDGPLKSRGDPCEYN
jgi:hypothetical protein